MAPRRLLFALVMLLIGGLALPFIPSSTSAQDSDDDLIKELRKKKKREKAIAEGKDPDAEEAPKESKPRLPDDANGWISTIQRKWDSNKPDEQELVHQCVDELKKAIGENDELRSEVRDDLQGFKEEEAADKVEDAIKDAKVKLDDLREVLKVNRPKALKAIANPAYTEADDCKLQPEVDAACKPLFDVWRNPIGYAEEHMGLDITTPAAQLDKLAALLGEIDETLGAWPGDHKNAASYMREAGEVELNVKGVEYKANAGVLEMNEELEHELVTDDDKLHVRVLNDYRMMLGKNAVSINTTLCKACKEHCKHMAEIGRLAHDIDGHPYGRTPQDRAKRAGYGGWVYENCLSGAADGDAAVWQWYNAAEHHRNMIGNHATLGIANHKTYWTQNFAGGGRRR